MAAVVESDSSLAMKCLDICQALTSQGKIFNFSLSIGPTFSFSFTSGDKTLDTRFGSQKKKQSPSSRRRSARRKEEFLNKRRQVLSAVKSPAETAPVSFFSCDQCDYTNASEKGLRQHKRMKHGKPQLEGQLHATSPSTPENLRNPISYSAALQVSPVEQSTVREETCPNCDEMLTSDHQCDQSDSDEEDSENEEDIKETEVKVCGPYGPPLVCHKCTLFAVRGDKQWTIDEHMRSCKGFPKHV
jgi:hypothetical protein